MPVKSNLSEIGLSGLIQFGGYVQEEQLRELQGIRWQKNVREMVNDPVIAAAFFAIDMLTRQVTWDIQAASDDPEDQQIADFVKGAMFDDMSTPWKETVSEVHSYLPWGWSYHEIVYKRRTGESADPSKNSKFNDNKIGWRKWPIRAQESLDRWDFDDNGGVQGMFQRAAPTYETRLIPIEKALLFRTATHKNNPEGRPLCRPIFRPWYFKKHIENIEGIGLERDLAGLPVLYIPAEYINAADGEAEKIAVREYCKTVVTNIKNNEQAGLLLPSDVYEGTSDKQFDFKLVSTGGTRQFDTNKIVQRKNLEILITLLMDFLMLGHEKVGSFALASSKTDMFATALGAFLDSDCEVVNRHAIPRLLRINGMPAVNPPKLTHGDIESVDLTELGDFISTLSGAGITLSPQILSYVLEQGGLPVPEDDNELMQMIGPPKSMQQPPVPGQPNPDPNADEEVQQT